ncbi:MAG: sugar phosphate nucleotidyltransferase [Cyclobacteriaceae bacterium]|nr:nucleotidyltransferase [Cyclobacteriaceae bacterium]
MNIIIPMAGLGKRLRPHTLTTPKPLLPIAGKPIVHRLVEDIAKVCPEKIDFIGFIIHPSFGADVEQDLLAVAKQVGAQGKVYYQKEALGISHALLFAKEIIEGKVIIAFADTLFRTEFKLDTSSDGVIWVQKVDNPAQFGVVRLNQKNEIIELVEKPSTFVSDLAIIGIYYIRDGAKLRAEMQHLLDHDIKEKGEYQLTTALARMTTSGARFTPGQVDEWLDCGNKQAMIDTNKRYLEFIKGNQLISSDVKLTNSHIIGPCSIASGCKIENAVVGPHVSIGEYTTIRDARISNSIIGKNSEVSNAVLSNSMLGNFVNFEGNPEDLSLGDYSTI